MFGRVIMVESLWWNKGLIKTSTSPLPAPVASTSYSNDLKHCTERESEAVALINDGSLKKRKRRSTPTFTDSETSDEWCAYIVFCIFLFNFGLFKSFHG